MTAGSVLEKIEKQSERVYCSEMRGQKTWKERDQRHQENVHVYHGSRKKLWVSL